MKKVVVSLYGGLGNQLFQYSAARALALRNGASITLDLYWFSIVDELTDTTPRKFALGPFDLQADSSDTGLPWHRKISLLSKIKRKLSFFFKTFQEGVPIYSEKHPDFDPLLLEQNCPVWLNGYWQSYKYFDAISDTIKREIGNIGELNKDSQKIYNKITSSESICMHIRRGDYVTNPNASKTHGLCSLDYYVKGLQIVSQGLKTPTVFIFSDDPEWVRSNVTVPFPSVIVDVNGTDDAHQDLWLMKSCQRFIIANSSLSWWAAWLAESPKKIVVSPKNWFLSNHLHSSDLIPLDWVRL